MTTDPTAPKQKRVRRTKEQIAATHGAELASQVARLPLKQLASFAATMRTNFEDEAEYLLEKLGERSPE